MKGHMETMLSAAHRRRRHDRLVNAAIALVVALEVAVLVAIAVVVVHFVVKWW